MSAAREPAIKTSHFAAELKALSVLGLREAEARARLAPVLDQFAALSRADWVPLAWDIELTQTAFDFGGAAAVHQVNRETFLASAGGPLLGPLFGGALSVFGVTPRAMLKVVAHGWVAGTHDLGAIRIPVNDDGVSALEHVDVPEVLHGNDAWAEGQVGLFQGICEFVGHRCLSVALSRPSSNVQRYDFTWAVVGSDGKTQ
jgi:hypothetical protein